MYERYPDANLGELKITNLKNYLDNLTQTKSQKSLTNTYFGEIL